MLLAREACSFPLSWNFRFGCFPCYFFFSNHISGLRYYDFVSLQVDKLRCIAEQHLRKDNSVIVPSPALPRNEENLKTAGDSPSLDMSKSYCLKIDSSTLNTTTKHSIPTGAHRQGVVAIVSSPSKTTTVIEQNQVMDDK